MKFNLPKKLVVGSIGALLILGTVTAIVGNFLWGDEVYNEEYELLQEQENDKEYYLGLLNSPLDEVREILKAEGWEEVNGRTNPSYGDSWEHWERNRIRIEILFTSDTNQINAMAYGDAKFQSEEHYLRRFMNSIPTEEFEKLLENEGWELFTQKLGASSWKEYHRQASNRLEKLTLTYHGNELVDLSYDCE